MIPDQQKMWNAGLASMAVRLHEPSDFASNFLTLLKPNDKLLELGCGIGLDARLFAENGIDTVATDFANQTISQNKLQNKLKNLKFETLDTSNKYPYKDEAFDCIYACLSLHYFTHVQTRSVFTEIQRVLKGEGMLAFRCKSTTDPTYGQGEEVEPNMYVSKGHVRHFFTTDYAQELLDGFTVISLKETSGSYDGFTSNFIDCVAQKK